MQMVVMSMRIIYILVSLPSSKHGNKMAPITTKPPMVGTPFFATLNGSVFSSRWVSVML